MNRPGPFAADAEFLRLLGGEAEVSLPTVALEIARDARPDLDIGAYLARIDELTRRAKARCQPGADPRAVVEQVRWIFDVEEEYRGDLEDYQNPSNSHLDEVINRKRGIPITLSILFAAVAAPLGVRLPGVGLPGHYVLHLAGSDPPAYVDAFHGGRVVDRAECQRLARAATGTPLALTEAHFRPMSPSGTVARMLRNLKAIHLGRDDFPAALAVVRRLAALHPDDPEAQRDWGMVALRTGHPGESIGPLSAYLRARPSAADADGLERMVRHARREAAECN